jgi:organic radical activating enzyme
MIDNSPEQRLKKLNSVSPCFCLAKWLQVTVDLVNGTTHSCHHPLRHAIPIEELAKDPSALHNTNYKKQQRKLMLEGVRPSECSYCWDIEDLGNSYSDRFIKSNDQWAWSELERVAQMPWDQNINPRYLEVMVDTTCNFSCAYCMADISTSVAAEMEKYGPYPISKPYHRWSNYKNSKNNRKPYVEAFEKWLPTLLSDLKVFRITGGEPLLSPVFWNILKTLEDKKNPELVFAVNSHLKHDSARIEKLCNPIVELLKDKKIKSFELYTSLDTYGEQAEYIRHGLDYSIVLRNIEKVLETLPDTQVVVMCTFNILSISSFDKFLLDISKLKKKYKNLLLDISYLRNPDYLRADMATPQLIERLDSFLKLMSSLENPFTAHEISKLENLIDWVKAPQDEKTLNTRRNDFYRFVHEYDRRKKKNFLSIFPDYRDFYITCKATAFHQIGVSV